VRGHTLYTLVHTAVMRQSTIALRDWSPRFCQKALKLEVGSGSVYDKEELLLLLAR